VIYALNPQIEKLRELNASEIRIPRLEGGPKLDAAFKSGYFVWLTVSKERKKQFSESVQKFKKLAQDVSSFEPDKFLDPGNRQSTVDSLNTISRVLADIDKRIVQRFGRPISAEALSQIHAEVELLNRMLIAKGAPGAQIDKSNQAQVAVIEKDIRVKSKAFS